MKTTKKTLCALITGVALLAGSAFADTAIGSGYKKLKEDVKTTARYLSDDESNYSAEWSFEFKADEESLIKNSGMVKYDAKSNCSLEENESFLKNSTATHSVTYSDPDMRIFKNGEAKQHIIYYNNEEKQTNFTNGLQDPFEYEYAKDFENVIDAFTGSLQDTVMYEENDGKTVYTCALESSQIPTYINAMVSLLSKQIFSDEAFEIAEIKDNVYIENADAKVISDKSGRITNVFAKGVVSGRDKDNKTHKYSCEMYLRLYDINATVISKPKTEEDAEVSYVNSKRDILENCGGITQQSVGKYKRDITETNNGKLEKIGERELVISKVDFSGAEATLSGSYKRSFTSGKRAGETLEFEFEAKSAKEGYGFEFDYDDESGEKKALLSGDFDGNTCYLAFGYEPSYDGGYQTNGTIDMIRVFE